MCVVKAPEPNGKNSLSLKCASDEKTKHQKTDLFFNIQLQQKYQKKKHRKKYEKQKLCS